jgi:hypothetical protein
MVMVESQATEGAMGALGMSPEALGKRIVDGQLRRGFTVIRTDDRGEVDFGMGLIPVGERPYHPYEVQTNKRILANDRTEIHTGQQDFIGAFEVEDDGQALYLTVSLDGTASIDVLVVGKAQGDSLVDSYVRTPGPKPVPSPVLLDESLLAGAAMKRFVPVSPGGYFLILDHSAQAGHGPPPDATADRAGKIDYLVMLGDAP